MAFVAGGLRRLPAMRASFVVLLSGVAFPVRVVRILDHVGPAVMAALGRDNHLDRATTVGSSRPGPVIELRDALRIMAGRDLVAKEI